MPLHLAGVLDMSELDLDELVALIARRRFELREAERARAIDIDDVDAGKRVLLREVERPDGGGCFRLEKVRCGKQRCRCSAGALHGPYWYVYTPSGGRGGRPQHRYIGKPGSDAASLAGLA